MTDSYQFWVPHKNLRVTFQSHIRFARKVQKYGDAFSKSSSIFYLLTSPHGHQFDHSVKVLLVFCSTRYPRQFDMPHGHVGKK